MNDRQQVPELRLAQPQLKSRNDVADSQTAQAVAVKAVLTLRDRFPKNADVLERLNRNIRRGTNVVGIFPNREATLRPMGRLLQEIDED